MNTAKILLAYLMLALVAPLAFAEANQTDISIRDKMVRQISNWSASHGGAIITYEHIASGYETTLDATMKFSTFDGQLNCEKVGFNIAVCENRNGRTVTLPTQKTLNARDFGTIKAGVCPPQIVNGAIDTISHHCRLP